MWYCKSCKSWKEIEKEPQGVKLFFRDVDDIVRLVKGDPERVIQAANRVHPHLLFTIETLNASGYLVFLGFEISIEMDRRASCGWYQKPTDRGIILNFRSCAPFSMNGV